MSGSVRFRILSTAGVSWRARGVAAGTTTGRWQDKSAHGAARSVGCFCGIFFTFPWFCHKMSKIGVQKNFQQNAQK